MKTRKDTKTRKRQRRVVFRPDIRHTSLLKKVAKESAAKAIRETKALGLPITYLESGIIYKESADGKRVEIGRI